MDDKKLAASATVCLHTIKKYLSACMSEDEPLIQKRLLDE
jgi:hypothetical protein